MRTYLIFIFALTASGMRKKDDPNGVEMMAVHEVLDMCFVRVCSVLFSLRTRSFLALLYKETSICTTVPFFTVYVNIKGTHIIIIISTIVQYSIVSVLMQK